MADLTLVPYTTGKFVRCYSIESTSGSLDFLSTMLASYLRRNPEDGCGSWSYLEGWSVGDMPSELENLVRLCDYAENNHAPPWRQVVDWLLGNEDDVPPDFMKCVKLVVDGKRPGDDT